MLAARTGVEPGAPSPAGIVLDAASVAAKLAWLTDHRDDSLEAAAWLMTPRDLVVRHLTGTVATDVTMASRSGLYDMEGELVEGLAGPVESKLPAGGRPRPRGRHGPSGGGRRHPSARRGARGDRGRRPGLRGARCIRRRQRGPW